MGYFGPELSPCARRRVRAIVRTSSGVRYATRRVDGNPRKAAPAPLPRPPRPRTSEYLYAEKAAEGVAAFCIGVYPLTHDKEILSVPRTQFDVGLHDIDATLDRDSLHEGWEENTIVGIADLELRGEPTPWDSRHVLRQAVEPWRQT